MNYTATVLLDGLPGMPDNIRLAKDQRTLMIPLPEERLDLPLNWPVIKHYALFVSYNVIKGNQNTKFRLSKSSLFKRHRTLENLQRSCFLTL